MYVSYPTMGDTPLDFELRLTPATVAPPQISEEEMRQQEAEAGFTIQRSIAAAVILYFCALSPLPEPGRPTRREGPGANPLL